MNGNENKAPAQPTAELTAQTEPTASQPAEIEISGRRFAPAVAKHINLALFTAARVLYENTGTMQVEPRQVNEFLWNVAAAVAEACASVEQKTSALNDGYLAVSFEQFEL